MRRRWSRNSLKNSRYKKVRLYYNYTSQNNKICIVGDDRSLSTSVFYCYLLGWFAFHAVRFCFMCWACDAVSAQSRGAACRVHQVMAALPVTAVRMRERLYEYSFALRNCPLTISAMGFFDMDLRLCLSVSGKHNICHWRISSFVQWG